MNKVELKIHAGWECHTLYSVYEDGEYKGQVEVQFENGEFNGKILYTSVDSENENGEFEWEDVEQGEFFDMIKEQAIKDYK